MRPSHFNPPGLDDPKAIVEAYRDPVRGRALTAVSERPDVTIDEVAARLGESPDRVRVHLDALLGAGLVEITSEESVGGATQHRFGAGPIEISPGASAGLPERIELGMAAMRLLMGDLAVAAAAGTLSRRPDDFEVRTYGEVDAACFQELVELNWTAYRAIYRALREGIARIGERGERGTEIVTALFFFEAPLWGAQAPRRAARFPVDRSVDCDAGALGKACAQPVRWRILTALSERPDITIREVADHLGESRRRVRHHIETLVDLGLAVVTSEDRSRVVERRYGAGAVAVDDANLWTDEGRLLFANAVMRTVAADFTAAVNAQSFSKSGDDFEVRMYGEVDETCLEELAELHWSTYRGIRSKLEEGYERVMESGEPGTEVVVALFAFEAPLWRHVVRPPRHQETA